MVKLRLKQIGKKHDRKYRIVAIDSRKKRDGEELEVVGFYDPIPNISNIKMDLEAVEKWLNRGAVMTERVEKIYNLVKSGKLQQSK
jgi:small subunit ribosomal protein S16